jgi:hypothetical protein
MYQKISVWMIVLLCINGLAVFGQSMQIAKDGMAILNGKRTFMLGLYEFPNKDEVIREVSESGFKIVGVSLKDSSSTKRDLDRLLAFGLGGWITGNFDLSNNTEKTKERLRGMVHNFGSHPALLAWEVPDEALWNISTKAWDYRTKKEIKLLEKEISEVVDSEKRGMLEHKIKMITAFYLDAAYTKGQQTADSLWNELGKKAPGTAYDITAMPREIKELARGLKDGYDFVKGLDPGHPIFMNHAPRNQIAALASFSRAADIIGCDIYPVPEYKIEHSDLTDLSLSCVGAYTQRMREAAPGKPVWMVLQGFGWGDYFFTISTEDKRKELIAPTMNETRFMAYDAIVNGARGISYWGTYVAAKDAQIWKDILAIAKELNDLQPVISSKDSKMKIKITIDETFNSFDRPIKILPKQVGQEISFILVNENKHKNPVTFTINNLNKLNGTTYVDYHSGKEVKVVDGCLKLSISGQGFRVLSPKIH